MVVIVSTASGIGSPDRTLCVPVGPGSHYYTEPSVLLRFQVKLHLALLPVIIGGRSESRRVSVSLNPGQFAFDIGIIPNVVGSFGELRAQDPSRDVRKSKSAGHFETSLVSHNRPSIFLPCRCNDLLPTQRRPVLIHVHHRSGIHTEGTTRLSLPASCGASVGIAMRGGAYRTN
ncbi:hypothetical protein CPB85DRAFT_936256 [Mucidula mucida]|nr:hypothetical protein CPB85DRAFT_936256 [Mucidula mucida]